LGKKQGCVGDVFVLPERILEEVFVEFGFGRLWLGVSRSTMEDVQDMVHSAFIEVESLQDEGINCMVVEGVHKMLEFRLIQC
jgi:hypothetical protein